jgi:hypothetical protein
MAYQEPELPVATEPVSVSSFGAKVCNAIIWLKEQVDALLAAPSSVISGRIGGSATVWATPGTTGYAPTAGDYHLETGVVQIAVSGGSYSAPKVTYKTAFTNIPVLLIGSGFKLISGSYSGNARPGKSTEAADSFYATVSGDFSTSTFTIDVSWLAIGA